MWERYAVLWQTASFIRLKHRFTIAYNSSEQGDMHRARHFCSPEKSGQATSPVTRGNTGDGPGSWQGQASEGLRCWSLTQVRNSSLQTSVVHEKTLQNPKRAL